MLKSLAFFFSKLQQVLWKKNFFLLVKSYSILAIYLQCTMKIALFLHFLRSLLITHLITVSLEKEIIVLKKVWKKS